MPCKTADLLFSVQPTYYSSSKKNTTGGRTKKKKRRKLHTHEFPANMQKPMGVVIRLLPVTWFPTELTTEPVTYVCFIVILCKQHKNEQAFATNHPSSVSGRNWAFVGEVVGMCADVVHGCIHFCKHFIHISSMNLMGPLLAV